MTFGALGFCRAMPCLIGLFGSPSAFAQLTTDSPAPEPSATPRPPPAQSPVTASAEASPAQGEPNATVATPSVIAPELAQGVPPSKSTAPRASPTHVLGPAPVDSSRAPSEDEQTWYGWQTLTADAISIAALATGIGLENVYLGAAGAGGFLFAAPAVHWYRGAVGRGFISFGIRFTASALIVVGGAACVASSLSGDGQSGVCAVPVVGLILVPTSLAVDAAALAWEKPPTNTGTRTISPWFSAERRAGGIVWQGTF